MRTIIVGENEITSEHFSKYKAEVDVMRAQRVKLGTVYIRQKDGPTICLKTTSKDIGLFLLNLGEMGRYHFANFLKEETQRDGSGEALIVNKDPTDEQHDKGLLATMNHSSQDFVAIHLSPAR